ncbi:MULTISPECIES: DUF2635 domain-containing protein [unclassified Saccharibacter]|uniref:DUF2635 domain-containing protein n=1 Tax=unclassified Saccharibacter TaxID=2648722 RepID=UPI0013251A09|nr:MULTISPECIES: DUF2635 domain-containing protein [unclassified Saccharibacter]MXV35839.1 DUF2635 domain-containing protein [Saccharibacter sp. EH611]MXV57960.1 DUF2635 domain-containing protein [Saccharibacter sp. EH70]MXV66355.1 DUF2635 domain-containing protein [Saccharibacter sp. EH60]
MSDDSVNVRPAAGRRVMSPRGADVPAKGFAINPRDPWWARALRSGDIVPISNSEPPSDATQAAPILPSKTEEKK